MRTTPEDSAAIARFCEGQTEVFDELMRRYERTAYCFAYRLTRNKDEASDIVAETFVRAFRSLAKFKGECSFSSWLYRIETNCFLDLRKKSYYQHRCLDDMTDIGLAQAETLMSDTPKSAHELVEASERMTMIQTGLSRLSPRHRVVLTMYHMEDMSYEEIAETLNTPVGTVKSRLNRARTCLERSLKANKKMFIPSQSSTLRAA